MKLNLFYVSSIIGETYRTWKSGDIVLLEAQTGTGKNYFIKNVFIPWMSPNKVLFISNRINLKRQVKKRLLEERGLKIPETLEELDGTKTIENVTVASYHALQHSSLNEKYKGKLFDISKYSAIILDECHFVLSDSGYNNLCRFTYKKLIVTQYRNLIKIFMSATMDEIRKPIAYHINKILGDKSTIHKYETGNDYSNVYVKYLEHYNYKEIITNLIINDKTDEKWLIFVSDLKDGKQIMDDIGEDKCSIIKSGTKSEELTSIINDSCFKKKVLIASKALDNGINIKDELLTNIVILAWDKISTLQMLGRKRIKIDNAQEINLYISTRSKKAFQGLLRKYNRKQADIDLLLLEDDNKNSFNHKYDNKLSKISDDIIYKEVGTNEFMINPIGEARLHKDIKFAEYMTKQFEDTDKFAYIREQLGWLGLEDMFDEDELIEEVMLDSDIETLESYLGSIVGEVMLQAPDREELIEKIGLIDTHNSNVKGNKIKFLKNINTLNSYFTEIGIDFYIKQFETSRIIEGEKKKYKSAWKVMRLTDK